MRLTSDAKPKRRFNSDAASSATVQPDAFPLTAG